MMITPRIAVAAAVCILALGALATTAAGQGKYVGKPFPNFEAKDALTGKQISLDDYRGKVVLIDFWATWCGPCVKELPNVKRAHREYKGRGFEIISISLDKDKQKFKTFARRQKMSWAHVMEGGGWGTRLAKKYGIRSIPAMFLIDHEGVCISDSARGTALGKTIERALGKLPAPPGGDDEESEDRESASREADDGGGAVPMGDERIADALARAREARRTLESEVAPILAIDEQIDLAARSIEAIESQLPAPAEPDSVRRRYVRLHEMLVDVRREMFVCGFLNRRTVSVPGNPFAAGADTSHGTLLATARELKEARVTVAGLRLALAEVRQEIEAVATGLERLERRLRRPRGDMSEAVAVCDQLVGRTEALRNRCRMPWREQLAQADTVLEELAGVGSASNVTLEAVDGRIERCRAMLAQGAVGSAEMTALRDEFTLVCNELEAMIVRQEAMGAVESIELPENPFEGSRLRGVRGRVAAAEQIDRAADASKALRAAAGASNRELTVLVDEIHVMQQELASADTDTRRLEKVKRRFDELSGRILEYLDGA